MTNSKRPIDPFTRLKIPEVHDGKIIDKEMITRELPYAVPTELDKLRLNLVVALGSPFRVKYDLIERALAILHMIEQDKAKLHDTQWIYIYRGFWNSAQRELEKIDTVWKDLKTKRSSQDQLKAFSNIEIFIEFLTALKELMNGNQFETNVLIKLFIDFLKEKGLFI